jgi:hypothetical protein
MNLRKCLLIVLFVILSALNISAQQFDWKAGYLGFFDDRESDNLYAYAQTMFGCRISTEAGVLIDDRNRFGAGIDYLYEFGSKGNLIAPDIIMYYNGSYKKFDFSLGAFPRFGKLEMPLALLKDSLNYYRPNIEGFYLEYNTSGFKHNFWVDWTTRKSETVRESFSVGLSGFCNKGIFVYQHHFLINHLAYTAPYTPGTHLRDNAGYSIMAGIDFTSFTGLDSLVVTTGILGSSDYLRDVYGFRFPIGWIGEAEARYKGFGLHGLIYSGDEQDIITGDRSFNSGFYTRADAYYRFSNKLIDSRLQISFHHLVLANEFSAQFVLRVRIGGNLGKKQNGLKI